MSDSQSPLMTPDPAMLQQALTQGVTPPDVGMGQQGPVISGSGPGGAPPQEATQSGPPKQSVAPLLARMLQTAFKGGPGTPATGGGPGDIGAQPGKPGNRLDAFEGFLGEFLNSFSQGMAQGGTGPGANARGFGAAVQAPYQRELGQYQLGQQEQSHQAQIAQQQAETQRTQAQAQMVPVQVGGQTIYMPPEYAKNVMAANIGAEGRIAAKQAQPQYMSTPFGIMDTKSGKMIGGVGGGPMAMATVTPEMAKEYGIDPQYINRQIKNSDLVGFMNANSRGVTVAQGSTGPSLVNKSTGATQNLGLGSPAANPLAQAKVQVSTAKDARAVETNQNQVNLAIDRLQSLRKNSGVLTNMIDAGKISLTMGGDGIIRAAIGRNVQLTPQEKQFAADFQTMSEDINLLRLPQGGGGFRSEEAFEAMQAQRGRLSQNPDVFNGVMDNTIASFKGIQSANQNALDTYNSVLKRGKDKATGGAKPGTAAGPSKVDSLAQKYGAK